jgi:hypothetical protein
VIEENSGPYSSTSGLIDTSPSGLPGPTHGTTIDVQPDKSNLRYDGKTFDEWRNAWKNELSTEKRLEGIKALATFGRAGFGKEAAEAILDVAGEYDFMVLENREEDLGKFKATVLAELTTYSGAPRLAPYWVPELAKRVEKDPKKWSMLAAHLFYALITDDPAVIASLQSIASSGSAEMRGNALYALVQSARAKKPGGAVDDKTRDLIDAALQSKNTEMVRATLPLLQYSPSMGMGGGARQSDLQVLFRPALIPLLFDSDEQTRRQTRQMLSSISEKDATNVIAAVLAVLKDKSRERDHLEAVRALAAVAGRDPLHMKALGAVDELQKLCKTTDDGQMFVATLVALTQSLGSSDIQFGSSDKKEIARLFEGASDEELDALSRRIEADRETLPDQFKDELNLIYNQAETSNVGSVGGGFF